MPTTVLFVRHTDVHNPDNVFYGRLPYFGLSTLGIEQANRTAEYLRRLDIAAFYTSPLLRARQTSRILAQYHPDAPVLITSRILEVRSSVQGQPFSRIGAAVNIYEPPLAPGDETIPAIFARMSRCLTLAAQKHPGRTVVCVSHADPIMFLRVGIEGKELVLANMRGPDYPEKGSVTSFVYDDGQTHPTISYVDPNRVQTA